MARLEGASNHKLEFHDNIYVKFHVINPPSAISFLPTPKKLANKGAKINLQNKDDKCFLHAVGLSVFSDDLGNKNPNRISKKLLKCCERLNIDNINFSPTIKDIKQFEKDDLDIFITIFEYGGFHKIKDDNDDENTKKRIVIKDVRVSPYALKRKHLVELLIIKEKEKTHFTIIKSISRLLRGSKHVVDYFTVKIAIFLLNQKKN